MALLSEFIHLFVPGSDEAPPLLVLHGTGGDEKDLLPLARMISADSAMLSPRGRVLEQGMPRYFRRLAEGVFDLEDLALRTTELADFVVEAATEYGFDAGRLIAVGYSNGANIAASLLLSRPEVLAGGILMRPMLPFEPQGVPAVSGKRVLLSAGRTDPMIPQHLTERLAQVLREGGADVTLDWYPTGHGLTASEVKRATDWLHRRPS